MIKRILLLLVLLTPVFLSGCVLNEIMSDVVNKAPRAVIGADPREGAAPLSVRFDGRFSHDDDGEIVEYRWDFGDPASTGTEVGDVCEHTFTHPGTYLVKLTIIDDHGSIDSQQIAVVVTNAAPVAEASVNNDSPLPGVKVIFNASASYDAQDDIASYEWDFGDGNAATGVVAEHTYKQGGYYVATLVVTDSSGAAGRTHLGINVQPGQSDCDGDTCGGEDKPYAIITATGPVRVPRSAIRSGSTGRHRGRGSDGSSAITGTSGTARPHQAESSHTPTRARIRTSSR